MNLASVGSAIEGSAAATALSHTLRWPDRAPSHEYFGHPLRGISLRQASRMPLGSLEGAGKGSNPPARALRAKISTGAAAIDSLAAP